MFTRFTAALRALVSRRKIAAEIDDELQYHVDREAELHIARGVPAAEARRRALAELGGLTQTREYTNAVRGGAMATWRQLASLRLLRRQPLFVIANVLTLALAVAAATTIAVVIKPALFDPLPYENDEALIVINTATPEGGRGPVNAHTFRDLRATNPPFASLTASRGANAAHATADGVHPILAVLIEPNYFATLGVTLATGRMWEPNDANSVVISPRFWRLALDEDPAAVGRSLTIDGVSRTIVGIMPESFIAPWMPDADVWLPLNMTQLLADPYRARRTLTVIARRAAGTSTADVDAYLALLSTRLAADHPNVPGGQTLAASALREHMVGSSAPILAATGAAASLLLLIVAANIAGLSAVRAISLGRETAVKMALGAGRARIHAERWVESLVIAIAGSAAGVWLSLLLISILGGYQGQFLPRLAPIALTPLVAALAFGAGTILGTVAGVLPHLALRRRGNADPLRAARGNTGDRASARLRLGLAAVQTALALVLVIGAGLLVRTLAHLSSTPLGFAPERLSSLFVNLPGPRYATQAAQIQFERDYLERLQRVPGVEAVTASIGIPVNGGMGAGLFIAGRPGGGETIHYMSIAPNFPQVLGLPLLSGRHIDDRDVIGAQRTLVINETMAKKYWPNGDAVGARIFVGVTPSENWMTIVGIVADVRQHGPGAAVMPTAFGSSRQYSWPRRNFVIRSPGSAGVAVTDLRAILRDVDPTLALTGLSSFTDFVSAQQTRQRLVLFVVGGFAAVAAVLCAFGVYGVLALTSSLRRREYAIRLALGSTAERVRWLVVRQALLVAAMGVFAGVAVSWFTSRSLQGLLIGVQPTDPVTFALASVAIVAVALVASWLPARRAATVNGAEVFSAE